MPFTKDRFRLAVGSSRTTFLVGMLMHVSGNEYSKNGTATVEAELVSYPYLAFAMLFS